MKPAQVYQKKTKKLFLRLPSARRLLHSLLTWAVSERGAGSPQKLDASGVWGAGRPAEKTRKMRAAAAAAWGPCTPIYLADPLSLGVESGVQGLLGD